MVAHWGGGVTSRFHRTVGLQRLADSGTACIQELYLSGAAEQFSTQHQQNATNFIALFCNHNVIFYIKFFKKKPLFLEAKF